MVFPGFTIYFDRHRQHWCWRELVTSRYRNGPLSRECGFSSRLETEVALSTTLRGRRPSGASAAT